MLLRPVRKDWESIQIRNPHHSSRAFFSSLKLFSFLFYFSISCGFLLQLKTFQLCLLIVLQEAISSSIQAPMVLQPIRLIKTTWYTVLLHSNFCMKQVFKGPNYTSVIVCVVM